MKIWIDIQTGTWGSVDDLYVIDDPGPSSEGHPFDAMSDNQIASFGMRTGQRIREIVEEGLDH